jgi:peroxiredoxin Q/BCP
MRSFCLGVAGVVGFALLLSSGPPAAADQDPAQLPAVGKPAPNIELPATQVGNVLPDKKDGKTLNLKDLRGKNVVLYFYPKAMTPGCTKESCGYRDVKDQFAKLDTVVIGISTDTVEDQQKFTDKEQLNFPLFADADKKVAKEYGVLGPRGVAQRTTFVIDKKGVVRKVYTGVNPTKNPQEVLDYVKESLANQ